MFRKVFSFIIWVNHDNHNFHFCRLNLHAGPPLFREKKLAGSFSKAKTDSAVGLV